MLNNSGNLMRRGLRGIFTLSSPLALSLQRGKMSRLPKLSEEASGSIISLFAEKRKLGMRERMKSIRRIHEGDKMQIYEKINKTSWKLFGLDYEQSLLFGEVGRASQKKKN